MMACEKGVDLWRLTHLCIWFLIIVQADAQDVPDCCDTLSICPPGTGCASHLLPDSRPGMIKAWVRTSWGVP